jgi:hypothetical protein
MFEERHQQLQQSGRVSRVVQHVCCDDDVELAVGDVTVVSLDLGFSAPGPAPLQGPDGGVGWLARTAVATVQRDIMFQVVKDMARAIRDNHLRRGNGATDGDADQSTACPELQHTLALQPRERTVALKPTDQHQGRAPQHLPVVRRTVYRRHTDGNLRLPGNWHSDLVRGESVDRFVLADARDLPRHTISCARAVLIAGRLNELNCAFHRGKVIT